MVIKRGLVSLLLIVLVCYSSSVSAIIVPSSNIKTVEFFIAQNPTTVANITVRQYNFSFYIPENTPVKRYAWIELQGVSAGQFDNNININLSNNASEILSLDSAGETQRYVIRYPFYPQIINGDNGPYSLNVRVSGSGSNTSLESAKLIITYEYDSTSPRQLKTVKYFVGQNDSKPLNGTNVAFPFSITVPESGPIDVRSAFLEFEGISNGTRDNFILVNTTSATTISHELKGTVATQQFAILYNASELYSITSAGEFGYLANIRGNLATVSAANARAVVTYEYDSNATNQQRTVRYLVASDNSSAIASGTVRAYNFSVPIAENNVQVQSAFIKFSGWITAVNSYVIMNISNTDTKNISIGIDTEGSGFSVLYNATQLYNMTTGVNGPYIFRTRIIGAATTLPMAELYLTYNYSANSPVQMKTVEYAAFNDDMQRTAAFDFDQRFMFIIPETNISAKSVFLESNSITSATAAHTLTCSLQGISVNYPQGNTGETTFDYILHDTSMTEVFNLSEGVNGAYQFSKGDSAVASLTGAKAVATFFFQ
jgi:hypothetical protein